MSVPYDVSTVVSRSYIPEQLQDNMQRGQELKNAAFLAEFQKEYEKQGSEVKKTPKAESASASDKSVKPEEERKKKKRRQKKENRSKDNNSLRLGGIDIQA